MRRPYAHPPGGHALPGRGGGTLSIVGIGDEVKLDLTPLWLKLQTIKGVYAHAYNDIEGRREHVFQTAIRFAAEGRVQLKEMVPTPFPWSGIRN